MDIMGRKKSLTNRNIDAVVTNKSVKQGNPNGTGRGVVARIPGFVLKDDEESSQWSCQHDQSLPDDIRTMYEKEIELLMGEFGDLGLGVVGNVVRNHGGNVEDSRILLECLDELLKNDEMTAENQRRNDMSTHRTAKEGESIEDQGGDACSSVPWGQTGSRGQPKEQSWDLLPIDCKRIIWTMLSTRDIHRAAATSKEWYEFSKEALSWQTFVSVNRNMNTSSVRSMISSYHQSNKIKIDYRDNTIGSVLWHDAEAFYRAVRLGEDDRWRDKDSDPVDINTVMIVGSEAFDQDELGCLIHQMRYMRSLSLLNCSKIGDDDIHSISRYQFLLKRTEHSLEREYRCLESFHMIGTRLTHKGLKHLIESQHSPDRLLFLDVSRSRSLTSLVPPRSGSFLRSLTAKKCPNLKRIDLVIPQSSLTSLELQDCRSLEEVHIRAPQAPSFRHVNLSGCTQLTMLSLDCPNLETLQAASCSKLNLRGPYISGIYVPKLDHLNINSCREVDDEGFSLLLNKLPRGLKSLNVGGCIHLTDISVKFQPIEGCYLDAYGCPKLKSLCIRSPEPLDKLVVSGCKRLVNITITGQDPKHVNTDHCESLKVFR